MLMDTLSVLSYLLLRELVLLDLLVLVTLLRFNLDLVNCPNPKCTPD